MADGVEEDTSWMRQRWARGYRKMMILRDIAEARMTQREIGEKYGVVASQISQIGSWPANKLIIDEIKKDIENEFAGLWIAQKKNRIAEYEQQAELLQEVIARSEVPDPALVRAHQAALRSIAEELAQLPNCVTVQNVDKRVNYSFDGVDPEDLR